MGVEDVCVFFFLSSGNKNEKIITKLKMFANITLGRKLTFRGEKMTH